MFKPRPEQAEILNYTGGKLGVAAVPGSGKTHTLSYLAARLVRENIQDDQEVLIVTFANAAVNNFHRRIRAFLEVEQGLLPDVGYRVRTLHGLAHDIIRERPALLGLPEDFQIADERESNQALDDIVANWLRANTGVLDEFILPDIEEPRRTWVERNQWPDLVRATAGAFIRRAKDLQATPTELRFKLPDWGGDWALARMGLEIYEDYQRALAYRGKVDFDDLVRLALEALQIDHGLLARLQARWPYILEDEAQDSSELQEKILRLLTAHRNSGGWVRVGDPNQSINTTFTTSSIRFLNDFLEEEDVTACPLYTSGRSTQHIIDLANGLVDWTTSQHPHPVVRDQTFRRQHIHPTGPDDPQPNPLDDETLKVVLYHRPLSPAAELKLVVDSLAKWLPEHRDQSVAVLTPDNRRGFKLAERLRQYGLPYDEMLQSTTSTRQVAHSIERVLRFLDEPLNRRMLSLVYDEWAGRQAASLGPSTAAEEDFSAFLDGEEKAVFPRQTTPAESPYHKAIVNKLRGCDEVESFLWPRPDQDWLESAGWGAATSEAVSPAADQIEDSLLAFRAVLQRWLNAKGLPIDQLILTIAQDLFYEAVDLALAHKIAVVLRGLSQGRPEWRLREMSDEVMRIANNQQRFLGFSEDDLGFTPKAGRVTVATMHKAKGLEWDRVYLTGVNNYDFPSAEPHDTYRGERWFIRNQFNLEAEAIAQLEAVKSPRPEAVAMLVPGQATHMARLEYTQERLRLLYVGITRARRECIITWNVGNQERLTRQAAAPFLALYTAFSEQA